MERLTSLINKLEQQIKQGADSYELLATSGLIRKEIEAASPACSVVQQNSVSVWLPSGYKAPVVPVVTAVETITTVQPALVTPAALPIQEEVLIKEIVSAPFVPSVPSPPRIIVAPSPEPEPVLEPVLASMTDTRPAPGPLFYQLEVEEEEIEEIIDEPVRMEVPKAAEKPFPQYPDAAELIKSIFQAPPASKEVAREVNQLVFETAIPLNQHLHEKKVELAEVLAAGPKISDLRKAITINEKYQMINTLFRGDDNMFERSVRTLNNFGSLPEARFWMQRELTLKLGWNEEDELVQYFYKLVSRRFS